MQVNLSLFQRSSIQNPFSNLSQSTNAYVISLCMDGENLCLIVNLARNIWPVPAGGADED